MHTKAGVHTRGDLHSVGIWKLARPGPPQDPLCGRDVPKTQGRREWALEMERNMDRKGSSKPCVVRNVRTFGDLIDLHDEDMREVGKPPRRSKAAVMASLKTELGSVKLPALNRERLIEFGRKLRQARRWPRDLVDRFVVQPRRRRRDQRGVRGPRILPFRFGPWWIIWLKLSGRRFPRLPARWPRVSSLSKVVARTCWIFCSVESRKLQYLLETTAQSRARRAEYPTSSRAGAILCPRRGLWR